VTALVSGTNYLMSYTRAANTLALAVNGVANGTLAQKETTASLNSGVIGAVRMSTAQSFFDGKVAAVAIYASTAQQSAIQSTLMADYGGGDVDGTAECVTMSKKRSKSASVRNSSK